MRKPCGKPASASSFFAASASWRRRVQAGGVAEAALGQELPGRDGGAFHHPLGDGAAVDRQRQRPADAGVPQRVARDRLAVVVGDEGRGLRPQVVEAEEDEAEAGGLRQRQPLVAAQLGEVAGRHLVDDVDVAGQQRRGAGGVVGDHPVVHPGPGGLGAPVAVVALELDAVAVAVADHAEGAGADRHGAGVEALGRRRGMGLAVEDHHAGEVGRHQRIGRGGVQPQGVAVDDLHPGDRPGVDGVGGGRVRHLRHALEGEGHILGGECGAVVEAHAAAQLELPDGGLDRAPAFGQVRDDPGMAVRRRSAR